VNALTTTILVLSSCLPYSADSPRPLDDPKIKIEFRRAEYDPAEGLTEAKEEGSNLKVYLHRLAELTNEDIAEIRKGKDASGKPIIEINFTKAGAKKMEKLTSKERLRKPLALLVDGQLILAPRINAQISDKCVINANFTAEQVDQLIKKFSGK
jgi:preprotein translocase subunit SecD